MKGKAVWLGSVVSGLLVGAVFVGACSDKSRRMGEAETLEYKRGLIVERSHEISPVQGEKLMYFPGRTRAEIDEYFEKLAAEYALQRQAEEADWKARNKEKAPSPSSLPPASSLPKPVPGPSS